MDLPLSGEDALFYAICEDFGKSNRARSMASFAAMSGIPSGPGALPAFHGVQNVFTKGVLMRATSTPFHFRVLLEQTMRYFAMVEIYLQYSHLRLLPVASILPRGHLLLPATCASFCHQFRCVVWQNSSGFQEAGYAEEVMRSGWNFGHYS